jgi:DNA-binding protein HU-beta
VRKQDLIRVVANEASLSEAQATKAVNAFLDAIHNGLARDEEIQISGFGSFKTVERAGREGRNPRTGEPMKIAARRSPTFKPGTQLKRSVERELRTRYANTNPIGAVRGQGSTECPAGYPVKGNVDSGIYHVPGSSSYAQTIPEFCFSSAEAAEAAGFHAPEG